MKLPKIYDASAYESDIYQMWEDSGAFQPTKKGDPFSIVMPPPNATGKLHVGHAAMLAIEDTLVRYQRMQGKSVLWVPGTDHAAIATNAIMERQLTDEGTDKHELGREAFLGRLHDFIGESSDNIRSQIRAMGASTDWIRERYTMEPAMNRIVSEVFIKMHQDGLMYRGSRIINWDNILQTTVSDDEVEHKEEKGSFYTFKYGPFEIGTSRPETKFGDKYVVMHPDDKRYKKYEHGQTFDLEWINGPITATVIKDEAVDIEFGTGVMTITPWHDATDFGIAERHDLDKQQIINLDGKLLDVAGEFAGMHIKDARAKIVAKMDEKGLLIKQDDDYVHNVAMSDRGKAIIEPQIMEQWFIDVNKPVIKWKGKKRSLKEVMQMVVRDGDIEILPQRFDKTYFNWIDNLRDWNVSRQIWWGHQIPAWYKIEDDGSHTVEVGYENPGEKAGEAGDWKRDPDTLDTWFSSALWSWSTLIDPEVANNEKFDLQDMLKHSPDYQKFHPNSLMETGYDILFFWVARMILMTTYITGEIPFKTVYLHGMVRTSDGSKMSKSKPETMINPMDVIPKYGTDALRLSLLVGQAPGNDVRISEDKIAGYRNFCNKLWNIARYVEGKLDDDHKRQAPHAEYDPDHWILDRLQTTATEVEKLMEAYDIGKAYEKLYHFIWDDFADWYVEVSKVQGNTHMLVYLLEMVLKMAHPFAPFVTETIWDTLKWEDELLIEASWPKIIKSDKKKAANFGELQNIVREVRNLRAQLSLNENHLYHNDNAFLEDNKELIMRMTGLQDVLSVTSGNGLHLTQTVHDCWLDVEQQKAQEYLAKLAEKLQKLEKSIDNLTTRLSNKKYVSSAPKALVEQTKQQMVDEKAIHAKLKTEVANFEYAIKRANDL